MCQSQQSRCDADGHSQNRAGFATRTTPPSSALATVDDMSNGFAQSVGEVSLSLLDVAKLMSSSTDDADARLELSINLGYSSSSS